VTSQKKKKVSALLSHDIRVARQKDLSVGQAQCGFLLTRVRSVVK
jgi:hypothetical protein